MEMQDPPENRRYARVPQELKVHLIDGASRTVNRAEVLDLSRNGLGLKSPFALRKGEGLCFRLQLPNGCNIQGDARVRWAQPQGPAHVLGLEIVQLGWLHRIRLRRYLTPGQFGVLEAADLALQCASAVVFLLVLHQVLLSDPVLRRVLLDMLPSSLAVLIGLCALFRR